MTRILLVDNHDSFTHNLAHGLAGAGARVVVVPHEVGFDAIGLEGFDGVVISPGPGRPSVAGDVGVSRAVVEAAGVPVLGVCLGHQLIAEMAGARVGAAPRMMHGRASRLRFVDDPLFAGLEQGCSVVRYHSLAVEGLPDELVPLAWAADDGVLMALRHRSRPVWGVQFHPESVCTEGGARLLANFVGLCGGSGARGEIEGARAVEVGGVATHRLRVERVGAFDPEAAYLALFAGRGEAGRQGAVWLDGARFDVMGVGAEVVRHRVGEGSVWAKLEAALAEVRVAGGDRPFPFGGGLVGYVGYECKAECGGAAAHRSRWADAVWVRLDRFVVWDRVAGQGYVAAVERVAGEADGWVAEMRAALAGLRGAAAPGAAVKSGALRMARSAGRYRADIEGCFAALQAGESYELCLTTQLVLEGAVDPVALHRRLRRSNPAPYAGVFEFGDVAVVSASPERFLRVWPDGRVEARPIKGTRARGAEPAADAAARDGLAGAEKDRAENLMIVDLLRNDLGRVCRVGSVHVPDLMAVEAHPTVWQMVSTVRGELSPGVGAVGCVRAAFPGGSMTGAPKERTMQILDGLEGEARGVYSGAMGWLGFDGGADLAIVIRTAVVDAEGCRVGVGGAVVALSSVEDELAEALLKGQALADALGVPIEG